MILLSLSFAAGWDGEWCIFRIGFVSQFSFLTELQNFAIYDLRIAIYE